MRALELSRGPSRHPTLGDSRADLDVMKVSLVWILSSGVGLPPHAPFALVPRSEGPSRRSPFRVGASNSVASTALMEAE